MAETIREMISEEKVDERIRELGRQISEDYAGKQIHLICVLKGGVFFMCELAKRINVPVSMDFMCVGSYGDGTASSGVVRIAKDLDESIENKEVLIVEDIIDSGNTLYYLIDVLKKRNPASMRLCTLLDKPDRRVKDVKVDYCGFEIPDEFVEMNLLRMPGRNLMNKLQDAVLTLYNYDDDPDNTDVYETLVKGINLMAKLPSIACYAYQSKVHYYNRDRPF